MSQVATPGLLAAMGSVWVEMLLLSPFFCPVIAWSCMHHTRMSLLSYTVAARCCVGASSLDFNVLR